jgi:Acetyltransferase (GNAT) domain
VNNLGTLVWERDNFQITLLKSEEFLRLAQGELSAELDRLAHHSSDPNVFYEKFAVLAALRHLEARDADPDLSAVSAFALVWAGNDRLVGFFPYQVKGSFRGLPVNVLASWHHRYCFLCTPLLDREVARTTTGVLFDWLTSSKAPAKFFEFGLVLESSVFAQEFLRLAQTSKAWSIYEDVFSRAALLPTSNVELEISGKHRKEMRRLERRLGERGELSYSRLESLAHLEDWSEEFLSLEAAGWKGRQGDAFDCIAGDRAFFKELVQSAWAGQQLQLLALRLDGKAIAMKCNFLSGEGSFSFKIAYDESFASFSPGVLLELYNMRVLAEHHPQVKWMDSCAAEKHFMANRLWPERRPIARYIMALGLPARSVMKAGQGFVALRRQVLGQAQA